MHRRHPTGGVVFLRVHSDPREVNLFLVGEYPTDGTSNGACKGGHGERSREMVVFVFRCACSAFIGRVGDRRVAGGCHLGVIARGMTTIKRPDTNGEITPHSSGESGIGGP